VAVPRFRFEPTNAAAFLDIAFDFSVVAELGFFALVRVEAAFCTDFVEVGIDAASFEAPIDRVIGRLIVNPEARIQQEITF
jgi:hypothetical protein